jgi:hypothetical protein
MEECLLLSLRLSCRGAHEVFSDNGATRRVFEDGPAEKGPRIGNGRLCSGSRHCCHLRPLSLAQTLTRASHSEPRRTIAKAGHHEQFRGV